MSSILFEHNQKAYESAVSMLKQTGKAAVVHPTGTGKSFIAFELCANHHTKIVCWLSPSEYIFRTQKEKWLCAVKKAASKNARNAVDKSDLKNIRFFTYARLMRMEETELAGIQPDYIVLDEFHRCGATQWGEGVRRLREMYPQTPVLGLSATNIRYLDNRRDMAAELFGGSIASELSLGEAVAKGILPAPKYVLSVYSYQKELARYEARVRQAKSRAVRDAAEKELEALRRALEKADGLEEMFARHMQPLEEAQGKQCERRREFDYNSDKFEKRGDFVEEEASRRMKNIKEMAKYGKYIVFCADYEHLKEMKELAREWFAKVDPAPHIYTAYSEDPATEQEFEAFRRDASRHLKLLYCIDMLNEGIHVDGVDGVILLRPTVSPIIYRQQIGRALATGGKRTPVIFDIVMNIENLCSVGALEEELREAVLSCRAAGRGNEIVQEHFQVIDEVADCRNLFCRLNETLGASWDVMYAMAKEYFLEHGDLEVPVHYVTENGYSLGAWIGTQRKVRAGKTPGSLSEAQAERLSAIGMRWQGAQELAWERNFSEAEKYFDEHGDLAVPKRYVAKSGKNLGVWLQRQRMSRKSGQLSGTQVKRLSGIGMVWEIEEPWKAGFLHAQEYFGEHGDLMVPNGYVCKDGYRLGKWISNQRSAHGAGGRAGKQSREGISEEQVKRLEEIGMVWSGKVGRPKKEAKVLK